MGRFTVSNWPLSFVGDWENHRIVGRRLSVGNLWRSGQSPTLAFWATDWRVRCTLLPDGAGGGQGPIRAGSYNTHLSRRLADPGRRTRDLFLVRLGTTVVCVRPCNSQRRVPMQL